MPRGKLPKIRFRMKRLKDVWGWAFKDENYIEIEERLPPYVKLNTLVHELYHIFEPRRGEERVEHFGNEAERIARRIKLIPEED